MHTAGAMLQLEFLTCKVHNPILSWRRGLKNVEFVGSQDPYCILTVGTWKFRSKTKTDAGKNPVSQPDRGLCALQSHRGRLTGPPSLPPCHHLLSLRFGTRTSHSR